MSNGMAGVRAGGAIEPKRGKNVLHRSRLRHSRADTCPVVCPIGGGQVDGGWWAGWWTCISTYFRAHCLKIP